MGIITISRGSYSMGREVAEGLAYNLGYECISREILIETSSQFNIPETKLFHAIHDAPSVLDRFTRGKKKYITFIREALLNHLKNDNVVYHGFAGHFFIKDVPNILKVRIIADLEDRIREAMKREDVTDEKGARKLIEKLDKERRKWSMKLYGIDTRDPSLYDIVLHIDNFKVNDAVEVLTDIARRPIFQTTEETQKAINDRYLAARAEEALIDKFPDAEVECKDAVAFVKIEASLSQEQQVSEKIRNILGTIDELKDARVNVLPFGTE